MDKLWTISFRLKICIALNWNTIAMINVHFFIYKDFLMMREKTEITVCFIALINIFREWDPNTMQNVMTLGNPLLGEN